MDDPPGSRLFLVCGRSGEVNAETLRSAFSAYGVVENTEVLRDKGVAYVKFDKASSAARAMESLNGTVLNNGRGPQLKVLLADSPDSRGGSYTRYSDSEWLSDPDNVPPRSRLFIVVPKHASGSLIQEELASFPGMEYCKTDLIQSKGVVFCKYNRASTALMVLESIKETGNLAGYKVKCMLAEPKVKKSVQDAALTDSANSMHSGMRSPLNSQGFEPGFNQAAAAHALRMLNTPSPSPGFSSLRSSFESQHLRNSAGSLPSPNALSLSADFHTVGHFPPSGLPRHGAASSSSQSASALPLSAGSANTLGAAAGIPGTYLSLGLDGSGLNSGSFVSTPLAAAAAAGASLHQPVLHGGISNQALSSAVAAAAAAGSHGCFQGLGGGVSPGQSPSQSLTADLGSLQGAKGLANLQQALNMQNLAGLLGGSGAPGLQGNLARNASAAVAAAAAAAAGGAGLGAMTRGQQGLGGTALGAAAAAAAAAAPPPPLAQLGNTKQRLFVVVHKGASREQIARLFKRLDGMEYCDLKVDRSTGKSKGYCYVNYSTAEMAAAAIDAFNGIEFPVGSGQRLKVMYAEPLGTGGRGGSGGSSARSSTTSIGPPATVTPPNGSPNGGEGGRGWVVDHAEVNMQAMQEGVAGIDLSAAAPRSSLEGAASGRGQIPTAISSPGGAVAAGDAAGSARSGGVLWGGGVAAMDDGIIFTFLSRPLPYYAVQHFFTEQVGAVEWVKLSRDDERYGAVKLVDASLAAAAVRKLGCCQLMGQDLHVARSPAPLHMRILETSGISSPARSPQRLS